MCGGIALGNVYADMSGLSSVIKALDARKFKPLRLVCYYKRKFKITKGGKDVNHSVSGNKARLLEI